MANIAEYLAQNLKTRFVGRRLFYFESTGSTMDIARDLAEKHALEGTVVIAGKQNVGRGRLGRSWLSPEGGLATSIILRPPAGKIRLIPIVASLAVMHALRRMGVQAYIKWPNDVLIAGKKVCGILIENGFHKLDLVYTVIGIGINVNFDTSAFPEIADIATSLSKETGKELPVEEVALQLYSQLENLYARIGEEEVLIREWARHMETLGKRVRVSLVNETIEGMAVDVNGSGNLLLLRDDGSVQEIAAGDVNLIRDQNN
ncbi:MAG: biotin--[acetyl-CoA-carboxylase] ligase [Dehalococcoidia bacterium]|jgi:BirA family biotin operon repressor/biotin-[acetyl-CoA-carboxylase] ligase